MHMDKSRRNLTDDKEDFWDPYFLNLLAFSCP